MTALDDSFEIESRTAAGVSLTLPPRPAVRVAVRNAKEWVIQSVLFLCAFSAVAITTGIVVLLCYETYGFFYNHGQVVVKAGTGAELAAVQQAARELGANDVTQRGQEIVVVTTRSALPKVRDALAAKFPIDARQSQVVGAPVMEFFTGTVWSPEFADPKYGILPLLTGTLTITFVALTVALPLGTIAAIYLSEYAPHKVRESLKPILELLSAVPTVVYGYFALLFVTPLLKRWIFGDALGTYNMLGAGLVMGIMIIPYVSSLSEDAMRAVPMSLREGSYAMGATRMQTAFKVVVPASFSGITAAYILGISRAIGETMVVALAAGNLRAVTANPTKEAQTITAYIVQVAGGDLPHGSIAYQSIFAAGLVLFLLTLLFNIGGYVLRKRYREAY
jgi:phosphate transport system permease protein